MGLELGIVGLPNVGKSTLFRAISSAPAEVANYPFCTIEPNIGVVEVPDSRLDRLAELLSSQKIIPNILKIVDIAGLVKGASKGEGLGSKFLENIRQVDAIAHIVRCFDSEEIVHVHQKVDPVSDVEIIKTELILKDLEILEKRIEKLKKDSKANKKLIPQIEVAEKLRSHLSDFNLASLFQTHDEYEEIFVREMNLLTSKPFFYLLNVAEEDLNRVNKYEELMLQVAAKDKVNVLKICCSLEAELSELAVDERAEYLKELNIEKSGLEKVIQEGFKLLDQISFFTAGPKEIRAWNLTRNLTAPKAAGKIHSDMEKGFIRVEVYSFDDIDQLGSEAQVKSHGKLRVEGHDYVIQDGDVLHVRFNV